MIHFIPAWYGNARPWYSTDEVWFRSTTQTQRDDTVTQLRVFREGAEEARLIVLNYAPNLRRLLHGQQLFDVPYWSLFDELQGLEDDYTRPLDVADLGWPDDVSFFYNPFLITVMRGFQVYARISLGRDGTLQSVRFYGDGMPSVERIFDDRGFLSSILMYDEQGQPMTQYYLSRAGDVLLSEDVLSGQIDIVQNPGGRFREPSYPGWAALVAEFLGAYFATGAVSGGAAGGKDAGGNDADTVVLALHPQHNEMVRAALDGQALVLSQSTARPSECSAELVARASVLFTDVGQADEPGDGIHASLAPLPTLAIYPLEHRPGFGASANEATVIISLLVDGMTLEELDQAIATMAIQLVADERTRLLVCTYRTLNLDYLQGVREVISRYQRLDLQFAPTDDAAFLRLDGVAGLEAEETIQLAFLDREPELLRTIAKTRVLVDLGERVNLALAAEAVNAGVPQINRVEHALAAHPLNGYLIESGDLLGEALDYFLSGLGHWNQSLVQCSVMKDLFSAREVLGRWELMKEGVSHARLADRG